MKLSRLFAISITGILVGFGLCGIDAKFVDKGTSEFGGTLSGWGFYICILSVLALLGCIIAGIIRSLTRKPDDQ